MKKLFFLLVLTAAASQAFAAEAKVMIADFDRAKPVSNLGQPIEVWLKDKGLDATQKTTFGFAPDDALGNPKGHSAALDYDVDSPNPAYNGLRIKLKSLDASKYKNLHFFVRGEAKTGFGKRIKIELIPTKTKRPSPYVYEGVTEQWQEVVVPLSHFTGIGDGSDLDQFVVVFADILNDPKTGTIYIDQVFLSND